MTAVSTLVVMSHPRFLCALQACSHYAVPAEAAESALEPFALALSRYEVDGGKLWEVEALIEGAPDRRAIRAALAPWGKPGFERLPSRDLLTWARDLKSGSVL